MFGIDLKRSSARVLAWVAVAVLSLAGTRGWAQDARGLNVQTFGPSASPFSIFSVETSPTLGHLEPTGAVLLDYASEPLVVEPANGGKDNALVDQQLAMHVLAGVGLFDRGELDLEVPVYFVNSNDFDDQIEGGVIGDLTVKPKVRILSRDDAPIGLTGAVDVSLPTGRQEAFVGDSGVQVAPEAIVDYRYDNLLVAANVGVRVQDNSTLRNIDVGERLEYGVGAEAGFLHGLLRVNGEFYGHTELNDPFGDAQQAPLEGMLGAKIVSTSGFSVTAGAGGGLVDGVGAPEFRAILGLRYAYMDTDADEDGIRDAEDDCSTRAEDIDGFEDDDGCPDIDNDDDGIDDVKDGCPQAEGPPENNGCPTVKPPSSDRDGDDVPDAIDDCPDQPGTRKNAGCAPPATSPDHGESASPGPDGDGDGIADPDDLCPDQPEDDDGFDDEDGCPDTDNDRDGLLDKEDTCPDKPGLKTDDGCPADNKKAVVKDERIELLSRVYFETDKAVIKPDSYNLLQQVGLAIRTHPDITQVEVAGYADQEGSADYNKRLSQARAKTVRTFLVQQAGVNPDRLVAKGYGIAKSGQTDAKDRHVEFNIVERNTQ